MGVFEDVQKQYPTLAFLFRDPEVGKLLRNAVDPNMGFSPTEFQARLYQTKWFRRRSQSQREWEILQHVDPRELTRRINMAKRDLRLNFSKLGFRANAAEINYIASYAVKDGYDVTDPANALAFRSLILRNPKRIAEGAVNTARKQVQSRGRQVWFQGIGGGVDTKWGVDIALGLKTEADLDEYYRKRAISFFPHLRKELEAGETMASLFDGHRQVIAEELELDPESVQLMLNHGQWGKVLRYRDPSTKKDRALTLSETRTLARQDPRFWKTMKGQAEGSSLSNMLLQTFGRRA